jgi:hypothetical protein
MQKEFFKFQKRPAQAKMDKIFRQGRERKSLISQKASFSSNCHILLFYIAIQWSLAIILPLNQQAATAKISTKGKFLKCLI